VFKLKQVSHFFVIAVAISVSYITLAASVDPTQPFGSGAVSSKNTAENKLVLQSIIHGDGIHTAVINGKVMKPGEHIGKYRLAAINDTSVVLRSDDERLKLYVFSEKVIK